VKERPAIAKPETRVLLFPRATTQQALLLFVPPEELEEEVEVDALVLDDPTDPEAVWCLRRSS